MVARIADIGKVFNACNVNENRWLCQAQLHEWQQTVSTSEELCIVAVLTNK